LPRYFPMSEPLAITPPSYVCCYYKFTMVRNIKNEKVNNNDINTKIDFDFIVDLL
jgi:hypothetical protein